MSEQALRGGIGPLLFPGSVAVVGASDRTPDAASDLEQVLRGGVPTWFVNPNRPQVLGRECFPSLTALPATPDCAYLLVGHARAEAAFEDVIAAGVRAVVLPGLGAEAGAAGREVAARIAVRAAEHDVAVAGPNCMGIATPGGVSLWLGSVAGPEAFVPGHVACVAHSGSIAEA
ncbi:MAG TPA: CoA-binding protein, partial [Gaiellales bacterium]